MTAPVGLRIGWEFLKPFQYAVLFVDPCGSRRRVEEEIPHHSLAARHDHAFYITVLRCAQRFRRDPLRRDATPWWNTPHSVGPVSSICHGLTRAFCIASSSYSLAQISTHRNSVLATPYRLSLDPRRPPKPRWPTSDPYTGEMLALRNKDRHTSARMCHVEVGTRTPLLRAISLLARGHPAASPFKLSRQHMFVCNHTTRTPISAADMRRKNISCTAADRRSLEWSLAQGSIHRTCELAHSTTQPKRCLPLRWPDFRCTPPRLSCRSRG
jgi:hypothetical protein